MRKKAVLSAYSRWYYGFDVNKQRKGNSMTFLTLRVGARITTKSLS